MNIAQEFAQFLIASRDSYPSGIPLSGTKAVFLKTRICFVVRAGAAAAERALLEAAATKGLGLKAGEYEIVELAGLAASKAQQFVALGSEVTEALWSKPYEVLRGATQEYKGKAFVVTFDVRQVLQDAAIKKEFWNDLRRILCQG